MLPTKLPSFAQSRIALVVKSVRRQHLLDVEVLDLREGLPLDDVPPFENALTAAEVDISGCEIVQALVVALIAVVGNEVSDAGLLLTGK